MTDITSKAIQTEFWTLPISSDAKVLYAYLLGLQEQQEAVAACSNARVPDDRRLEAIKILYDLELIDLTENWIPVDGDSVEETLLRAKVVTSVRKLSSQLPEIWESRQQRKNEALAAELLAMG